MCVLSVIFSFDTLKHGFKKKISSCSLRNLSQYTNEIIVWPKQECTTVVASYPGSRLLLLQLVVVASSTSRLILLVLLASDYQLQYSTSHSSTPIASQQLLVVEQLVLVVVVLSNLFSRCVPGLAGNKDNIKTEQNNTFCRADTIKLFAPKNMLSLEVGIHIFICQPSTVLVRKLPENVPDPRE